MTFEAWRAFKSIPVAAMLISLCPSAAEAQGARIFASLGTGEINGVYYPVGAAICAMVNRDLRDTGVRCSRELTPGSVYNIEAIRAGELEFAIVQSDVAFAAYNGNGAFVDRPFHEL